MASPSAILSILVNANTAQATTALSKFDRQIAAVDVKTRKGIRARLGGEFNPTAFKEYTGALDKAAARTRSRDAFKAQLGADFNNRGFNAYQRAVEKAGVESDTATASTHKFGGAVAGAGGALLAGAARLAGISLGVGLVGRYSVAAAAKFQQSMEQIHTQAGASQKEVDRLSGSVLKLSQTTATGPEALATGLYHLESQGLRGAKAMDALKIAAEGAKVGNANLEDVTNGLGAAVVSGIKGTGGLKQAMGELNAVVGSGDMHMQDLADALGTGLLGSVKKTGISLKDVGAALAVFGDNNIRGAKAGTALASAIRLMAAPSKAAADHLHDIGITANELGDEIRNKGLVPAFQDLKKHLESAGLTATQQARVLTLAFGGKQATGVNLLLGQLERLKTKEKEVGDGGGKLGQAWDATKKTMAFQLSQLGASFQSLGIVVGNALAPIVPILATGVKALAGFILQMQTGKGVGGEFANALSSAWKTISSVAKVVFPVLKTIAVAAFDGISAAVRGVGAAITWIKGAIHTLRPVFNAVFPVIAALVKIAVDLIIGFFKTMAAIIVPIVRGAFDTIKWIVENIAIPAFHLLHGPLHTLGDIFSGVFNGIRTIVGKVVVFILGVFSSLLHAAGGVFDVLSHVPLIGGAFRGMGDMANKAGDDVDNLRRQLQGLPAKVSSTVDVNVDFISNIAGAISAIGQSIGGALGAGSSASQAGHHAPGHFSGGLVTKPGYYAGEEAPQFPEIILASNPKYRQRNLGLFAKAGHMLGVPGFAAGGLANAGREVGAIDPWTAKNAGSWAKGAATSWLKSIAPKVQSAMGVAGIPGGRVSGGGAGAYSSVLPVGRVDQGLDFTGSGPIGAILDGRVIRNTLWPGWPGTGGVVYSTAKGNVYAMEHVQASVSTGQRVKAGQVIASVLPGYPWLETGWANAAGTGPLTPYNGAADGTPMPGGIAFKKFLGFAQGGITGKVSTFGPPGEAAGSTAYGRSSADPGISLRIPGTSFDDPRNRALMGQMFKVSIAGHSANLMDIDLGPASWTGRSIDVTGAGAKLMGLNPSAFPTDAIGTAVQITGNTTSKGGTSKGGSAKATVVKHGGSVPDMLGGPAFSGQQIAGFARIPSQSSEAQIVSARIQNRVAASQAAGNVAGNIRALNAQEKFDRKWLAADKAKLRKVNKALSQRGLSRKQRGALLQDKLALIQEIGTIQGDIGSADASLAAYVAPTDTSSGDGTDPNQPLIDAMNADAAARDAQTQAIATLTATLAQNIAYMKSVGAVETSQAIKALSDVISGQIGGNYLSRSTGSAGDGSVARYGSVSRA